MLAQVRYMLDLFYSEQALQKNFDEGHEYLLIHHQEKAIGFAGYQHHFPEQGQTKLHKLYVLPSAQGLGAGQQLLNEVMQIARDAGSKSLMLNVNRFNKAYTFYRKNKFDVLQEIDIPIGQGFLMQDYILEKRL
jgi:GNAT superfamily N-acetyltransferase